MEMKMELKEYPYGLQGKVVSKDRLARYFDVQSADELIVALRRCRREGYFDFEATLSSDYINWEEAHRTVVLRSDVLEPYDPFGVLKAGKHYLGHLYHKFKDGVPLTEKELIEVVDKLPSELADRYLQFKLTNVDQKKLRSLVTPRPIIEDEDFEPLEYAGLQIDGVEVTYLGEPIRLAYKERHVLRVLMENAEKLVFPNTFLRDPEVIDKRKDYKNPRAYVSKLISAVRVKLMAIVQQPCIINENKEGWKLVIQ